MKKIKYRMFVFLLTEKKQEHILIYQMMYLKMNTIMDKNMKYDQQNYIPQFQKNTLNLLHK